MAASSAGQSVTIIGIQGYSAYVGSNGCSAARFGHTSASEHGGCDVKGTRSVVKRLRKFQERETVDCLFRESSASVDTPFREIARKAIAGDDYFPIPNTFDQKPRFFFGCSCCWAGAADAGTFACAIVARGGSVGATAAATGAGVEGTISARSRCARWSGQMSIGSVPRAKYSV